jgi:uncharacterized Rmd1/YagE family protein
MYHLPLLPGYGPAAKVRSSVPASSHTRHLSRMSQAEEDGYTGSYFVPGRSPEDGFSRRDGYIAAGSLTNSPPIDRRVRDPEESEFEGSREHALVTDTPVLLPDPTFAPPAAQVSEPVTPVVAGDDTAEIVFFTYGVAVFFGFDEVHERTILEDLDGAGALKSTRAEGEWEVEECHFAVSGSHRSLLFAFTSSITCRSMTQLLHIRAYIMTFSVSVLSKQVRSPLRGKDTHVVAANSIQVAFAPPHALSLARDRTVDVTGAL